VFIGAFVVFATRAIWRDRLVDITPALAAPQIVDTMAEGLLVLDRDGVIRVANEAAAGMLGSPVKSLIGKSWADMDGRWSEGLIGRLADPSDTASLEVAYQRPDGAPGAAIVSTSKVRRTGQWVGTVCIIHDITDRQAEEQIRYLAFHDALTGASNRAVLIDRLGKSLAQARRDARAVGLIFVDLDGFKQINDTQGHDAGDCVLKFVAHELGLALRDADTLARVGGDEFVLLLPCINDAEEALIVAQRILRRLNQTSETDGSARCISASLGIAVFPHDAQAPETLLQRADIAMSEAKKRGGNAYQLFASLAQDSRAAIPEHGADEQRRAG
jgi:diguanylate cyclase (GGDEF)-like protein/PAS domain S-box-containing protein